VGYVDVYRNGVYLPTSDYTATTGTTVVLTNAATVGDTITTISFYVSSVLNAIPATANSVARTYMPVGSVLQVASTTKTDSFSSSSTSLVDVTGLSVSITPTNATSKILVFGTIMTNTIVDSIITFQLVRGSTNISIGGSSVSFQGTIANYFQSNTSDALLPNAFHFLDSPATTSPTTYKVQMKVNQVRTFFVNNRTSNDSSYTSTITVMEIAA
jgi:hypothetical protein